VSWFHAAFLAGGWSIGWFLFWRIPQLTSRPRSSPTPGETGSVAVIIPARDEAHALPDLLRGVIGADPRVAEVVVVDDGSTDETAAIARAAGARVVEPGTPSDGSTGKSWACTSGVRATTSDVVVFVDADVTFAAGGLTAVLHELASSDGLLSVEPFQRVRRAYERVSALFGAVAVMGTGAASPGRRTLRTAFGPVLACRRSDYEAVGGHAADPGAIAEDVALAARFAAAGQPVTILGGADLVSFRMYPCGARQMVEGWTKNIATGAGATRPGRLAAVVWWIAAVLSSSFALASGALAALDGRASALAVATAVWLAFALQVRAMFRQLGAFGAATPLLYPLLALAFVAIFARSLYLTTVRHEVRWKGRVVPLQPSPPEP
jgi:4,4'-diaponeurosporenoate glycosyltransferase